MKWFKAWLADLPSTALVIFTGCVMAVATAGFYFAATWNQKAIDDGNWTAWLMFVAATLGVGYAQFAKKRDTYVPDSLPRDIEDRSGVPKAATPTVVTVRPVDPPEGVFPADSERTRPRTSAESEEGG